MESQFDPQLRIANGTNQLVTRCLVAGSGLAFLATCAIALLTRLLSGV